jgi:hypothetical protein
MKRIFAAIFIFSSLFFFLTMASAGDLYNCVDRNGNKVTTDSPQDGMTDCVLKESSDDSAQEERSASQRKSYKSGQNNKKETLTGPTVENESDMRAMEREEAELIRAGNKCHTEVLNIVSGGSVSDVVYWRICRDKNGNTISRRRVKMKY